MSTIDLLAKMLEEASSSDVQGKCTWTDSNGQSRCNNFSKFQCQQASGTWDPNSRCDDSVNTGKT
jgi:hypothetical protein